MTQFRFICGPLPYKAFALASSLGGKTVSVLMLIYYRRGLTKKNVVTLPKADLEAWGISKSTLCRTLHILEKYGFVELEVKQGHSTRISLSSCLQNFKKDRTARL